MADFRVLVTGVLACVVLIAHRHVWRLDLTPEKRFTLSPHSKEALARLDHDVTVTAFYSSQDPGMRQDLGDLLSLYAEESSRVRTRILDLDRSPGAARQLGVRTYNTAIVTAGDRHERRPRSRPHPALLGRAKCGHEPSPA